MHKDVKSKIPSLIIQINQIVELFEAVTATGD